MIIIGLAVFLADTAAKAIDSCFFRIVSTQETRIISFDANGVLAWSNSMASTPPVRIEALQSLTGVWTNNFPSSQMQTNGPLSQVRVPLFDNVERWIVAFQPTNTLSQVGEILEEEELIWTPLAFDTMKMAVIYILPGTSLTNLTANPNVRYVEKSSSYSIY